MQYVGTISQLWRYPVKSMLGERCTALRLNARGIDGDRLFALKDRDGKFGSGKTTRRFRKIDGLLQFRASYEGSVPLVQFPTGQLMRGDDPAIDAALSGALGQTVTLAREADVSHLDAGPVHLLTSAALEWLRVFLPAAGIDVRRFRPNLVVTVAEAGMVEQTWLGKRLRAGSEVELEVSAATERCGMVTMAQEELSDEPRVLREIAQHAKLKFGIYANVIVPGIVRVNDRIGVA